MALLGLHVVGVVAGHPEFIWATFEHKHLAPNLDRIGNNPQAAIAIDNDSSHDYLFYKTGALAKDCNQKPSLTLDKASQTVTPITSVFHEFAFDETSKTPDGDIEPLNKDVYNRLEAIKSVWANYSFKGAVWINHPNPEFRVPRTFSAHELNDTSKSSIFGGERQLSNVTMETFTQTNKRCFSCHQPADESKFVGDLEIKFPGKKISVSHVLTNAYFNLQQQKINSQKMNAIKKMNANK